MKKLLLCVVMVFAGLLAGCSSGNSTPTLASIAVTPATASVTAGQSKQFKATGTYSNNSTQDLTATATWSSSNTSVATVSGGLAMGLSGQRHGGYNHGDYERGIRDGLTDCNGGGPDAGVDCGSAADVVSGSGPDRAILGAGHV
jgi:hypothetical protein